MEEQEYEVQHFHQNLKTNDLIIKSNSQIDNYGGGITRNQSKHLQQDYQLGNLLKKEEHGKVTHYIYQIRTHLDVQKHKDIHSTIQEGKVVEWRQMVKGQQVVI